MKMKWWEIAAVIALLGAMASLCYSEVAGFTSETAGRIWVGSLIVTYVALFGALWPQRMDSSKLRRWKAALRAIGPISQLIVVVAPLLILPDGLMNGPYCVPATLVGAGTQVTCLPLWFSILLFAPIVLGGCAVLMYGFWLRRENTENAGGALIAPPR